MQLTLRQVIGQSAYLKQKMLVVQSVLNSLRTDGLSVGALELDTPMPFSRAAVIWIFGAIVPRGILTQDGMMVVVQTFGRELLERAEYWQQQLEAKEELTPMVLAVSDRKLVNLAGCGDGQTYYDLQRCCMTTEKPPTFEGISYNLAIPVQLEWLRAQREIKDGADAQNQRSVPGPHNPGHSATGARGRPAGVGSANLGPDYRAHGVGGRTRDQSLRRVFEQAYGKLGASHDG